MYAAMFHEHTQAPGAHRARLQHTRAPRAGTAQGQALAPADTGCRGRHGPASRHGPRECTRSASAQHCSLPGLLSAAHQQIHIQILLGTHLCWKLRLSKIMTHGIFKDMQIVISLSAEMTR